MFIMCQFFIFANIFVEVCDYFHVSLDYLLGNDILVLKKKIVINRIFMVRENMEKIILIPKCITDSPKTYNILADLQHEIISCAEKQIVLDFTDCIFIHPLFTSFIGALSVLANTKYKKVFYRAKKDSRLLAYIKTSGLYTFLTDDGEDHTNKNSIRFKEIRMEEDSIIEYISNILSLAPIQLTKEADEVLFKNIYELLNNAAEHAKATSGVYACGSWMPKNQELVFSIYDTGVGIPALIREKINPFISSKDAIRWSLTSGNSTKQLIENIPRGIGLPMFKNFIEVNNGYFSIVSNDICYIYNNKESFHTINHPIVGTIISFIIRSDTEHIYAIKQKKEENR